ncbi:Uncharacterised protein [uncultured archaeon]|nr:Uncharacterised protein [uncultured archaeon]
MIGSRARLVAPLAISHLQVRGDVAIARDGPIPRQIPARVINALLNLKDACIFRLGEGISFLCRQIGFPLQHSEVRQPLEIGFDLNQRTIPVQIEVALSLQADRVSVQLRKGRVGDAVSGKTLHGPAGREALRTKRKQKASWMIIRSHAPVHPDGFVLGQETQILFALISSAAVLPDEQIRPIFAEHQYPCQGRLMHLIRDHIDSIGEDGWLPRGGVISICPDETLSLNHLLAFIFHVYPRNTHRQADLQALAWIKASKPPDAIACLRRPGRDELHR